MRPECRTVRLQVGAEVVSLEALQVKGLFLTTYWQLAGSPASLPKARSHKPSSTGTWDRVPKENCLLLVSLLLTLEVLRLAQLCPISESRARVRSEASSRSLPPTLALKAIFKGLSMAEPTG